MNELLDRLREYADSDYLPMHMPGHKRRMGAVGNPFSIDITEIDGFDNLHHADGLLREAQRRAAKLYRSEETHYLVNGSTGGILAAICGCTDFGGTLLMARNCHKSVWHAALLRGLRTEYLYPQSVGGTGINGPVSSKDVENALQKHPQTQAVILTSPTYDGIVSDTEAIAEVVHRHGLPLIVDAAHGAHFAFSEHFPKDAVSCGADVVIHSLHKTLPSLTQTALIHLNGGWIDRERIRRYLTVFQTSSPSYVLMASIDECVGWVQAHPEEFERFHREIQKLRDGLRAMKRLRLIEVPGMDESRILVSVQGTSLTGQQLSERLRREFHIELEMGCVSYVCAITTVADDAESLGRLLDAFLNIDAQLSEEPAGGGGRPLSDETLPAVRVCTFLEAEGRPREAVPVSEAGGRISADFVTPYPPGIPLLAPGERISGEIAERISRLLEGGYEVHGLSEGRLSVWKEKQVGKDILPDGEELLRKGYHI